MSLMGDAQLKAALALEGSFGAPSAMTALRPLAFRNEQSDDSRRALAQWVRLADAANDVRAFEAGLHEFRRADRPDEMVQLIDKLRPTTALTVAEAIASRFPTGEHLCRSGMLAMASGDHARARARFSSICSLSECDPSVYAQTMWSLAKLGEIDRDGSMVKHMTRIDAALLSEEQRRSYDRWSLWSPSPHVRATAIDVLSSRRDVDALSNHVRRMHVVLSPLELDRLKAALRETRVREALVRIEAVQRSRNEPIVQLRAIGRMDFSIEAWLAFSTRKPMPRASSADGTAALLIDCLRDQNEARANDVVKLMNNVPTSEATVLCWTALGLALGYCRVADRAEAAVQRLLLDDDTVVPIRGYIWLAERIRAAGGDAILAYERASYLREKGATDGLRLELTRQAWREREAGNVVAALALVRR